MNYAPKLTYLSRDPFARCDHVRITVPAKDRHDCEWCGSRPGRFQYGIVNDGVFPFRPNFYKRQFCSRECYLVYSA